MEDSIKDKYYLKKGIAITVDTVSIGALEAIEEAFGDLWGINIQEEDKTEMELELTREWEKARKKILQKAEECKKTYTKNLDKFSVKRKNYFREF